MNTSRREPRLPVQRLLVVVLLLVLGVGCRGAGGVGDREEADAGGDADVDADTDLDVDSDGDTDTDVDTDTDTGIQWVTIPGGRYTMQYNSDERAHEVEVPEFQIARTEVTIGQYKECVEVGICETPTGYACNFDSWASEHPYPVNCIDWYQARAFCEWIGARLPSEAEWEYAARNRGMEVPYPWGDADISCEYAVYDDVPHCPDDSCTGCGTAWMWPVCSKSKGNTEHGLCDMVGNLDEWMEDDFHLDFNGAPVDGSAWVSEPREEYRVIRGGSYQDRNESGIGLTVGRSYRLPSPWTSDSSMGFRPARSVR